MPESVKDNNKETVEDASSLIAKLDSIESMISSIPASLSTKNDSSYKDNQIDLLISEISSKNKEIERLKNPIQHFYKNKETWRNLVTMKMT